ncbi:AraC family transcriptional regulator [Undibacterium parvum]|uniref:AraC family transcriptional regulator n=1 Tax=Undibacterium parvum TaxID=401471 RepID=A0A3S9HIN5_9BURK|nr:AraC family transcriptional regulator [Undibacterium parvum]AZP11972.1 AraC family transcriptional regulator [Undibacterium parvum]
MPAKPPVLNCTLHPAYARLLYVQLRQHGVDADAVLAEAGLRWAELASDPRELNLATFERLILATQRRFNCPWLGLELGAYGQVSVHGAVGHAAISSGSLRQLLQTVAHYGQLRADTFAFTYQERDQSHPIGCLAVSERFELGAVRQFMLEALFATLMRVLETAVGNVFAAMRVDLPFAAPTWAGQYRRFGIGDVRFGSAHLCFYFPAELLDLPCLTADSNSYELARKECDRALTEGLQSPLSQRVKQALHAAGEAPLPDLPTIAQQLHVSPRTLMRKLKLEGSSYQSLLDAKRKEQAIWHLQHSQDSIEIIAERLGYQDNSNFSRTFRRWCGLSPSEFRNQFNKTQAG